MILLYHKVAPDSPTMWWVSVDAFYRQLLELQSKKVVYLDAYDPNNPDHVVITFDGVYQNVLTFAAPLLKKFGYPFELFLTSDHVGQDNAFDKVDKRTGLETNEPITQFTSREELAKLVKMGGRLQWHSRSHPNLTLIKNLEEITKELTVLPSLKKLDKKGFQWFAYPHGEFNETIIAETKKKFKGAVSVIQGNDHDLYQLNRVAVTNESSFAKASIGVVIPCYNYGSYLIEAIESVLKQTRPANKIIIINDGSSDNTEEIARSYEGKYPTLITYIHQPQNRGIIDTFNTAVEAMDTDYICLLGADNRFRSDYLEKTATVLDKNNKLAIAYTDFALFGPLAISTFQLMPADRKTEVIENIFFVVKFLDFTKEAIKNLAVSNIMHGSSLYRKKAWQEVGGYKKVSERPEDHHLFYRMVSAGWKAKRVAEPLLEYRQHSPDQVNTKINSYAELQFYKKGYAQLQAEVQALRAELSRPLPDTPAQQEAAMYKEQAEQLRAELAKVYNSKVWKIFNLYKNPLAAGMHYTKKFLRKILDL